MVKMNLDRQEERIRNRGFEQREEWIVWEKACNSRAWLSKKGTESREMATVGITPQHHIQNGKEEEEDEDDGLFLE